VVPKMTVVRLDLVAKRYGADGKVLRRLARLP
jgi:hypothetical protein